MPWSSLSWPGCESRAGYRLTGDSATRNFDSVTYESAVTSVSGSVAVIHFTDHLCHNGRHLTFECEQSIEVGSDGLIARIEHVDLAGQREALTYAGDQVMQRLHDYSLWPCVIAVLPVLGLAQAPYPASSHITGISWDMGTLRTLAPYSDNWCITWADNDHQYTSWGDGGGFGGGQSDGRVSMGIGRVEGSKDSYRCYNVRPCSGTSRASG